MADYKEKLWNKCLYASNMFVSACEEVKGEGVICLHAYGTF